MRSRQSAHCCRSTVRSGDRRMLEGRQPSGTRADAAAAPTPPTPGDTFGLTSANRLVTFNRATPAVRTAVAISGLQSGEQLLGIDIRPGGTPAGELYALGSTGRIYTINTTSGAATQKAQLTADSTDATNPFTRARRH